MRRPWRFWLLACCLVLAVPFLLAQVGTFPRWRLGGGASGTLVEVDATGHLLVSSSGTAAAQGSGDAGYGTFPRFRLSGTTGNLAEVDSTGHLLVASDATTLSGTVLATQGGTGFTSYAVGDVLYADTTTSLAKLADVAVGNVLIAGGVGAAPAWSSTPASLTSIGIGIAAQLEKLHINAGKVVLDTSGNYGVAKFNSQGTAWSSYGAHPALLFNADSTIRPEIAWLRGSRSYPEFAIRQHTTADKGGEFYAGGGTGAPTLVATMLATGVGLFHTAPAIPLDAVGLVGTSDTGNVFTSAKFDTQGNAWSTRTSQGSYILQGATGTRPEVAWYRGSRTYPEFALREHTTADTGGEMYAGPGTAAPTKIAEYTVNGRLEKFPTAEAIVATATITADACGGIKRISSASALTTNTTNTITAPAATNAGCKMTLCNVNAADAITLDKNANILLVGGADVVLAAGCCIDVYSSGASGTWKQTSAQLCSS
jgi:hypothetical protein